MLEEKKWKIRRRQRRTRKREEKEPKGRSSVHPQKKKKKARRRRVVDSAISVATLKKKLLLGFILCMLFLVKTFNMRMTISRRLKSKSNSTRSITLIPIVHLKTTDQTRPTNVWTIQPELTSDRLCEWNVMDLLSFHPLKTMLRKQKKLWTFSHPFSHSYPQATFIWMRSRS